MRRRRPLDWNAIRARIEVIADVLGLDDAEVDEAATDLGVFSFAVRHGQSLDWIAYGDVRTMIAECPFN